MFRGSEPLEARIKKLFKSLIIENLNHKSYDIQAYCTLIITLNLDFVADCFDSLLEKVNMDPSMDGRVRCRAHTALSLSELGGDAYLKQTEVYDNSDLRVEDLEAALLDLD